MPEQTEDVIVRNLIEALSRLHHDLDRVELWTAALRCFQHAAPNTSQATTICCRRASRHSAEFDRRASGLFPPTTADWRARSGARFQPRNRPSRGPESGHFVVLPKP
jgi:hypothetical protein